MRLAAILLISFALSFTTPSESPAQYRWYGPSSAGYPLTNWRTGWNYVYNPYSGNFSFQYNYNYGYRYGGCSNGW